MHNLGRNLVRLAPSYNITEEEFNKIHQETKQRGEEGFYNFILNLVHKDMNKYNELCTKIIEACYYGNIKRDDELLNLLKKVGTKYDICIFSNNYKGHLNKVYINLFGLKLRHFTAYRTNLMAVAVVVVTMD